MLSHYDQDQLRDERWRKAGPRGATPELIDSSTKRLTHLNYILANAIGEAGAKTQVNRALIALDAADGKFAALPQAEREARALWRVLLGMGYDPRDF